MLIPAIVVKKPSFSELYCARYVLSPDKFPRHLLRRAMYPHARLLISLLEYFGGDYFAADFDFIDDVGQLTSYNDFFGSSIEYVHHPSNRGFMRRTLRIRVSTERMRRQVRSMLPHKASSSDDDQNTMMPFGAPAKPPRSGGAGGTAPAPLAGG
jgi:hypothetical protein